MLLSTSGVLDSAVLIALATTSVRVAPNRARDEASLWFRDTGTTTAWSGERDEARKDAVKTLELAQKLGTVTPLYVPTSATAPAPTVPL